MDNNDLNTDEFFKLLANPHKISGTEEKTKYTIDDEIIRLLNDKFMQEGIKIVINSHKYKKIIDYIKLLK